MTGEDIAALQEPPSGKPWENETVREWEPAPFDPVAYGRWARWEYRRRFPASATLKGRRSTGIWIDDPLLLSHNTRQASRIAKEGTP